MNKNIHCGRRITAKFVLILLLLFSYGLMAQNHSLQYPEEKVINPLEVIKKFNEKTDRISGKEKTEPLFNGKMQSIALAQRIDSMVSSFVNPAYDKVKKTYQYDANGFFTNITETYYKDESALKGYSYIYDVRPDSQLNMRMKMKLESGAWVNDYRVTYSYDPNGNVIENTSEDWDVPTNSWVYNYKQEFTYGPNDLLLTKIGYSWSGGAWEKSYKYEYTYDANNNMLTKIKSNWNSGVWENHRKWEYSYDGNNNNTEEVVYDWNGAAWENYDKITRAYDANNNMISENGYQWDFVNNQWENDYWDLYSYNSDNKITLYYNKYWDIVNSTWVDYTRYTYTYNSDGLFLNILVEQSDGTNWNSTYELTYEYNADGKLISYMSENFTTPSKWRQTYRYNSMGYCNGGKSEIWNTDHWEALDVYQYLPWFYNNWYIEEVPGDLFASTIEGSEFSVYYEGVTSVNENKPAPTEFSLQQNYPNPFNPTTVISYSVPEAGFVSLKVYDVLGNEVATLVNGNQTKGIHRVTFNASELTSGIYFYRMKSGQFTQVRKMMLMK